MAELLVKAVDASLANPQLDQRGSYKRGYPVLIMEDGHEWGIEERLPKFVVFKFPGVTPAKLIKYVLAETDGASPPSITRRRIWKIRWVDLPLAARNKLQSTGQLIIKVGTYAGTFDYTWTQVKDYFQNQTTGLNETVEIT